MIDYTIHTIQLQDGTLCNFTKRVNTQQVTLLSTLKKVIDGRKKRGIRHQLPPVLLLLFCGITLGATTLTDCYLFALHNRKWLESMTPLRFGIPDPTTLSRILQKTDIDSLVHAFVYWQEQVFGASVGTVASFDGKTMNGCHGKTVIKHILSLFTHDTHQIIGQIGVRQKENEIPAFHRLLSQVGDISGMLLVGDALHTQTNTIKDIRSHQADYLLFVKGNQEQLQTHLSLFFADLPWGKTVQHTVYEDTQKGIRSVRTTITLSHDQQLRDYLHGDGWEDIKTIGKVHKSGVRITTDRKETPIEETYFLISSRFLTASKAALHTRNHWQIENNLHWEKDYVFLEDRQTLRLGNAPQVMSFLRSMCLSVFSGMQFSSPATAISNFKMNTNLHHRFLKLAAVV